MIDNTIALQVKPLDIATPLMQAAKMRQMESEQQKFDQEQKRDMIGEAATDIMSAPEHERQGLWNNKIGELRAKGAITDNDHSTLTNGYSPERLNQFVARGLGLKGYLAYDLQRGGMAADQAVGSAVAGGIAGHGTPPPGVLPPMNPAAAPPGGYLSRPPVQPSAKVWGDEEATKAGLYEPDVPMPQSNPFRAPAGVPPQPQPAPSAAPQPQSPAGIEPSVVTREQAAYAAKAMTNPRVSEATRALLKLQLEQFYKQQEDTPASKNYNAYKADTIARGGEALSRFEYDKQMKQAGATMINTAEGMDAAQTKGRITMDQAAIKDLAEKVTKTGSGIPLLKHIIATSKDTPQGFAGAVSPLAAKLASTVGIPVSQGMSNAELWQSATRQLIPSVREPGATSNYENQLYMGAVPNASQSHEGRTKIADLFVRMQQRDQEIVALYRKHLGAPELSQKVAELSQKPLFSPQETQWLELQGKAAGMGQPNQSAPMNKTSTGIEWKLN